MTANVSQSGRTSGSTLASARLSRPAPARWWAKITDIYDFGYEGPNKDVISADFTAMVGPAEEFGQLGYNDVQPGGLFVKPGIGVLKRDDGTYNHSRPYEVVHGGRWEVTTTKNAVEFTQTLSEPSIGYGYVYTKVLALTPGKPQLTIAHTMRNTGTKAIVTNVYNHNFTTIDKQPTGPDVVISVPWPMTRAAGRGGRPGGPGVQGGRQGQPPVDPYAALAAGERMGTQCGQQVMQKLAAPDGNRLVYAKVLEGAECYQASFTGFSADSKDNQVRIENTKTGAGVLITGDRPMSRFGYWSIRTVVAPEPYVDLNIGPGQTFSWSYTYRVLHDPLGVIEPHRTSAARTRVLSSLGPGGRHDYSVETGSSRSRRVARRRAGLGARHRPDHVRTCSCARDAPSADVAVGRTAPHRDPPPGSRRRATRHGPARTDDPSSARAVRLQLLVHDRPS